MLPQIHQITLIHQTDIVDHWHANCTCGWHAEHSSHDAVAGEGQNHATRWGSSLTIIEPVVEVPVNAPAPTAVLVESVGLGNTVSTAQEHETASASIERRRQNGLLSARAQSSTDVPGIQRSSDGNQMVGETIQERFARLRKEHPALLPTETISDKIEHAVNTDNDTNN